MKPTIFIQGILVGFMAVIHVPWINMAPKAHALSLRGTAGIKGPIEDLVTSMSNQLPELDMSASARARALAELSTVIETWYAKTLKSPSALNDETLAADIQSIAPFRAVNLRSVKQQRRSAIMSDEGDDKAEPMMADMTSRALSAANVTEAPLPTLRSTQYVTCMD